jgi:hypothetical protein
MDELGNWKVEKVRNSSLNRVHSSWLLARQEALRAVLVQEAFAMIAYHQLCMEPDSGACGAKHSRGFASIWCKQSLTAACAALRQAAWSITTQLYTSSAVLFPHISAKMLLKQCLLPFLQAPAMEWNEGHTWTLNVQLPVGAVNFKVVMSEAHGGVRWEQGENRSMLIPETTSVSGAPVGQVSWQLAGAVICVPDVSRPASKQACMCNKRITQQLAACRSYGMGWLRVDGMQSAGLFWQCCISCSALHPASKQASKSTCLLDRGRCARASCGIFLSTMNSLCQPCCKQSAMFTLLCNAHAQVGVTCNFNDVTNTRVEVRPDRNYLKQQLKAVEARVTAIQEKKRKLDARMSVLTEGLKVRYVFEFVSS